MKFTCYAVHQNNNKIRHDEIDLKKIKENEKKRV